MGIELEGMVHEHDVVVVLETIECLGQLPRAEVAEGTDDVAPLVDHEPFPHYQMVSQIGSCGRMEWWVFERATPTLLTPPGASRPRTPRAPRTSH